MDFPCPYNQGYGHFNFPQKLGQIWERGKAKAEESPCIFTPYNMNAQNRGQKTPQNNKENKIFKTIKNKFGGMLPIRKKIAYMLIKFFQTQCFIGAG